MALRMKPLPPNPELAQKLAESKIIWEKMTTEEKEEMLRKQRESWARQDMD